MTIGSGCLWSLQWWHTWFILGPLCDHGRDFALVADLAIDWLRGLFNTCWSATLFFFSSFVFSKIGQLQPALWPSQTLLLWRYSQLNYFLLCILIRFCWKRSFEKKEHHQTSLLILVLPWHLLEPLQAQGISPWCKLSSPFSVSISHLATLYLTRRLL